VPSDYIPGDDPGFDAFQSAIRIYINANLANLGLPVAPAPPDADVTLMNSEGTAWDTEYPAHIAAQNAAVGAKQTKDNRRDTYEAVLRRLAQRFQESSLVSDAELAAMSLTLRDLLPSPIAAPTSRPVGKADTSQRLKIGLSWTDEATPTSKAKPHGVVGCNIFMKLGGTAPADLSQCEFIGFATRTPFTEEFDGTQANQTAHFILQWVGTRGGLGPISETVSATVPG
jgi:hypothetical protein